MITREIPKVREAWMGDGLLWGGGRGRYGLGVRRVKCGGKEKRTVFMSFRFSTVFSFTEKVTEKINFIFQPSSPLSPV